MLIGKYKTELEHQKRILNSVSSTVQENMALTKNEFKSLLELSTSLNWLIDELQEDIFKGIVEEEDYETIAEILKQASHELLLEMRTAAVISLKNGAFETHDLLIEFLVKLEVRALKYLPSLKDATHANEEYVCEGNLEVLKEELAEAIENWETAETLYRGVRSLISQNAWTGKYLKYTSRRIKRAKRDLNETARGYDQNVHDAAYIDKVRANYIDSIHTSMPDTPELLESRTTTELLTALKNAKKANTSSKNGTLDWALNEVHFAEAIAVLEALDIRDPELENLYNEASLLLKKSHQFEETVILERKEIDSQIAIIYGKDGLNNMRINRELSKSPRSVDSTIIDTLTNMKIYAGVQMVLNSGMAYAEWKAFTFLTRTFTPEEFLAKIIYSGFLILLTSTIVSSEIKDVIDAIYLAIEAAKIERRSQKLL
ncbi:MAG TPA: hypothetical protein DCY94_02135 [Firmicutes bacterium]|nr:hypothetical protein [Bacillota bacterium]